MFYYEVWVSSPRFHGHEALTYAYAETLSVGAVVRIPLRGKPHLGIITKVVQKPTYATKPIDTVLTTKGLPPQTLDLLGWLHEFYPSPLGLIAQQALPGGLLRTKTPPVPHAATHSRTTPERLPPLSPQQKAAYQAMTASDASRSFLLHGDTGTGKTRLYMELATKVLQEDKSVMMITPEISLTPQLVSAFERHFNQEVIVLHSRQTAAERRNQWLRILHAETAQIIIGPRSTLFAPVHMLGLIVIDEAHDQALKQDKSPRYLSHRVAAKLASLHKCMYVIGTATPLISEYWLAEQQGTPIIRLSELPAGRQIERDLILVNLKDKEHFTKSRYLSNQLIDAIETSLRKEQQSLVFLNRRGTARVIQCQKCGWQALCPTCDLPLTYHGDTHSTRCHTCGYRGPTPSACPECSSHDIIFRSIGTKSLVDELQKLFPKARIKRYDTDNARSESLEQQYQEVADGNIDIIVGTQLVTKGLDLPKLAVVGVVLADTSLYLPDYSAEEQTYQMITQVVGRVGRGHQRGSVIVQTYQPQSATLKAATQNDWDTFYRAQIREREAFGFPPFYHFLKLTTSKQSSGAAQSAAEQLARAIRHAGHAVELVGPSPAFKEKFAGKYYWQLIVKAKRRHELVQIVHHLPAGWTADLDPLSLL